MRFSYILGRFPTLSETFVLNEVRELKCQGADFDVYALLRGRPAVLHREAANFAAEVRYTPTADITTLCASARHWRNSPHNYLSTLQRSIVGNVGNLRYLLAATYTFPKAARMAEEMQNRGVEHVHAHFAHHPGLAALIVHRLTGIPFSFTVHGHDLHCNPQMLREKVEAAAFVVTISRYNRELLSSLCGEHVRRKVHVVHCGIDAEYFRPATHDDKPCVRIVAVGSLLEVKGHEYLVRACARLEQAGVRFECLLIGEGPLRRKLTRLIGGASLEGRFRLLGALPQSEVARILQTADIAVQPSIMTPSGSREGIPVALMEAMAASLPVVASRLSGIPELVDEGESGFLVEPGDVAGLAGALQRLAHDADLRSAMGEAGRAKVLRDFNLHTNASKVMGLITRRQSVAAEEAVAA